jgi:hypothetical protein
MNSADVFLLEFDMLSRTSALAKTLEWLRSNALRPAAHRQLLLELEHLVNFHTRLREVAADVVPAEDWNAWHELLAVPALAFTQGRAFREDLKCLGISSLDSVSLTPLPQTIALEAYAHYQLTERGTVGLVGYLWFFERVPRICFPLWHESARRGGVPLNAMQALTQGPTVVDIARDTQVSDCCRQIVRRPRDLGLATQSLHCAAALFATMVDAAIERSEIRLPAPNDAAAMRGMGQVA